MAKILIADDDPMIGKLITNLLSAASWEIETAGDGQTAIDMMATNCPDLVVTDLDMPKVDGHSLTQHIAQHHPQVPVVILTAKGGEETAVACFRQGAADYIRKEKIRAELLTSIGRLLKEEEEVTRLLAVENNDGNEAPLDNEQEDSDRPPSNRVASLQRDYVVLQWGSAGQSLTTDRSEEREFNDQKLRILKRQVERLERWAELEQGQKFQRKHERHMFADVVYLIPYVEPGRLDIARRMAAFCRNISAGGCSLIRNRLLNEKNWGVFFPHLIPASNQPVCIAATIVRDRPITMGMYEIGLSFTGVIKISPEDTAAILSRGGSC